MSKSPVSETVGASAAPIKQKLSETSAVLKDTGSTIKAEAGKKAAEVKAQATDLAAEMKTQASDLAAQASEKAREAATTGKAKAAGAVGTLATVIEDVAPTLDTKLGAKYGNYARTAATKVSGIADDLDRKSVDELVADGKSYAKKNPAIVAGVVAAAGFVLARLFRGGNR